MVAVEMLRGPDQQASRIVTAGSLRGAGLYVAPHQVGVELLQPRHHRPTVPRPDRATVDGVHRNDPGERPGHERLVRGVDVGEAEKPFLARDPGLVAYAEHVAAGDAAEAVRAVRRPYLAPAYDEEVCRVAGGDEALRVEHQRLVVAGLVGLDARGDVVQLAVPVELRVEGVGRGTPHVHGEQGQTPLD